MAELKMKKYSAKRAFLVYNDDPLENTHAAPTPQITKKFVSHATKSSRRLALDDVSNKVPSIDIVHLKGPPVKKSKMIFEDERTERQQIGRSGLRPEDSSNESLPIETMSTNDFELGVCRCCPDDPDDDHFPLHLRVTLDDLDRWMEPKIGLYDDSDDDGWMGDIWNCPVPLKSDSESDANDLFLEPNLPEWDDFFLPPPMWEDMYDPPPLEVIPDSDVLRRTRRHGL